MGASSRASSARAANVRGKTRGKTRDRPVRRSRVSSSSSSSSSELREWLETRADFTSLVRLETRDDDAYGTRAVCASSKGISRGDVLLRIPRACVLTAREALGEAHEGWDEELSASEMLAVAFLREEELGERSRWAPYVRTLNGSDVVESHPLLWNDADVRRLPASSGVRRDIERRMRRCDSVARRLRASKVASTLGLDVEEWPSDAAFRRAGAIVSSRAFFLTDLETFGDGDDEYVFDDVDDDCWDEGISGEESGDGALALVPYADALNHSSNATEEALLRYDVETQSAVLSSHRSYQTGEQVFDSYGVNLSQRDLFMNYGFIDIDANGSDGFELSAADFLHAAHRRLNVPGKRIQTGAEELYFTIDACGVGEEIVSFATMLLGDLMPDTEQSKFVLSVFAEMCSPSEGDDVDDVFAQTSSERESLRGVAAAMYIAEKEVSARRAAWDAIQKQIISNTTIVDNNYHAAALFLVGGSHPTGILNGRPILDWQSHFSPGPTPHPHSSRAFLVPFLSSSVLNSVTMTITSSSPSLTSACRLSGGSASYQYALPVLNTRSMREPSSSTRFSTPPCKATIVRALS